jgi:hypothetical protein
MYYYYYYVIAIWIFYSNLMVDGLGFEIINVWQELNQFFLQ